MALPFVPSWTLLLNYFNFILGFFDHLHFRFAMMAQAVFPCPFMLRRRVKAIECLFTPLLLRLRRGSYGRPQACP